jgi:hypothetical protein
LGRPFLATGGAMIDVRNGELSLDVNGEKVSFNIFKAMKFHDDKEDEDEDTNYCLRSMKVERFDEKIEQKKEPPKVKLKDLGIGKNAKFGGVSFENSPNSSKAPYTSGGLNKRPMPIDLIEEPDGLACGCFSVLKKGGFKKFLNKKPDGVT